MAVSPLGYLAMSQLFGMIKGTYIRSIKVSSPTSPQIENARVYTCRVEIEDSTICNIIPNSYVLSHFRLPEGVTAPLRGEGYDFGGCNVDDGGIEKLIH